MYRVTKISLQRVFAAIATRRRPRAEKAIKDQPLRHRRGSVILIVLITIMFAAVALTLFIEKASNDLLVDAREADALRLRMEAYSALETTLGVLEDFRLVLGALHNPSEGWGNPLEFAHYEPADGRTVDVQFEDESSKISLPQAQDSTFLEVFKSWGLNQADGQKLTDALMGWMKKDHVPANAASPRAEDYDRGELPFVPPDRPLRSFSELASIDFARTVFYDEKGEPTDFYRRFVSAFSLYSYQQSNINGGNTDVFAGLGITDGTQIKRVQDYLSGKGTYQNQGPGYFKSGQDVSALIGAASPAAKLGTQIAALRIIVTVHQGHSSFRLNMVVAPQGGAKIPPRKSASNPSQNDPNAAPSTGNSTAAPPPSTGTATSGAASNTAKSLNYPFTILEIRENDQNPSAAADTVT